MEKPTNTLQATEPINGIRMQAVSSPALALISVNYHLPLPNITTIHSEDWRGGFNGKQTNKQKKTSTEVTWEGTPTNITYILRCRMPTWGEENTRCKSTSNSSESDSPHKLPTEMSDPDIPSTGPQLGRGTIPPRLQAGDRQAWGAKWGRQISASVVYKVPNLVQSSRLQLLVSWLSIKINSFIYSFTQYNLWASLWPYHGSQDSKVKHDDGATLNKLICWWKRQTNKARITGQTKHPVRSSHGCLGNHVANHIGEGLGRS